MKIFPVLRDDIQQGVVWLSDEKLKSRAIIKITNRENKKSVYCEALQIDANFLKFYNQSPRNKISDCNNSIVIGGWYRAKLGGIKTKEDVSLSIKQCNWWWFNILACLQHPQIVVRVGAWLGIIGIGLGLVSLIPR